MYMNCYREGRGTTVLLAQCGCFFVCVFPFVAPSTVRPLARDLRVLIGCWPFPLGFGLDGRLLLARRGRVGLCLIHRHISIRSRWSARLVTRGALRPTLTKSFAGFFPPRRRGCRGPPARGRCQALRTKEASWCSIFMKQNTQDRPTIEPTTPTRAAPAHTARTSPQDHENRVSVALRARGSSAPRHKLCTRRSFMWRLQDPFGS